MKEQKLLEIKNLSVSLDVDGHHFPILRNLSFSIEQGKVIALVGESGSGKSLTSLSLMRLLPKTLKITDGEILFYKSPYLPAKNLAAINPYSKEMQSIRGGDIAMIFQEPMSSFSPLLSIGRQISEVIDAHESLSKKEIREKTIYLLEKVGISDPIRAYSQYPHEFSGGMRQRAMIAKALSCNPKLLIADEPTTALDVTIQAQVLELMQEIQAEFNMAILFITHDLGVVAQMADEVAVMYAGSVVEYGDVHSLYKKPAHPYTTALLEAIPKLGDLERQKALKPIPGNVPTVFAMPKGCRFHPRCTKKVEGVCEARQEKSIYLSSSHWVDCVHYEPQKQEAKTDVLAG